LGVKIKMVKLNSNSVAVDEKSDVKKVEKLLNAKRN
jgi:CMP-2-keto-3-deoxyoctulosonic acid synthetase